MEDEVQVFGLATSVLELNTGVGSRLKSSVIGLGAGGKSPTLLHAPQALVPPSPGAGHLFVFRPLVCGSLGEILKSCLLHLLGLPAFLSMERKMEMSFSRYWEGDEGLNPAPPISEHQCLLPVRIEVCEAGPGA